MALQLIVLDQAAMRAVMTELEDLLRAVASAKSSPRTTALRYTQCRDALLAGPLRAAVPGFVVQCVSIYRFQDFINLYDGRVEARTAFITEAFGKGGAMLATKRRPDTFNDFDF